MKLALPIELRVAIIGPVSAGKSTVVNAMLAKHISETALRRTTAGVNKFCITFSTEDGQQAHQTQRNRSEWSMLTDVRSAESILKEIRADNQRLRTVDQVEEKTFDTFADEHICGDVWAEVKLCFMETPGLNEAGADGKYTEYIRQNWYSFDCVVAVMDASQGVNTDEILDFLRFLKDNQEIRKVPIIILGNKVDHPQDEQQQHQVCELREAVEQVHGVTDREESLQAVLETGTVNAEDGPIFIPVSAKNAYMYRYASRLDRDEFRDKLGNDNFDSLGRSFFGLYWNSMSEAEKVKNAYDATNEHKDVALNETNFHTFLKVLTICIGGEPKQRAIVREQLAVFQARLETTDNIGRGLQEIYDRCVVLEVPNAALTDTFWTIFAAKVVVGFKEFTGPDWVSSISTLLDHLRSYLRFTKYAGLILAEHEKILQEAKMIVVRLIKTVLNRDVWSDQNMTNQDWVHLYGSMLAMAMNRHFYENFCMEWILLNNSFGSFGAVNMNDYCFADDSGKLREDSTETRVKVPAHPKDSTHFGHPIWAFCSMSEMVEEWKKGI